MRGATEILDGFDDKPASYARAARELATAGDLGLPPVRVALAATFTIDVVVPYLVVESARRGLDVRCAVASYGQLEQQLLDVRSDLYIGEPDAIVIAMRIEDAAPALVHDFVRLHPRDIDNELERHVSRIEALIRGVRERTKAHVVVWNQPPIATPSAGLADATLEPSQSEIVATINRRIAAVCRATAGAFVFDAARVAIVVGLATWNDPKLTHWARVPLSTVAQIEAARSLARHLRAIVRPPCKCLVLDLDNTLWGGVLGEDGIGGIALGEEYPGSVFKAFQRTLRSYRDRGILLAIASKNNEADVLELFASHRDLVLALDDFAARQIHWNDKASSLRAIADQLGIGIDALAFFDDNPVERAWVREQLSAVTVIEVPSDPLHYATALDASGAFDSLVLTDEDRARAEMVRDDAARQSLEASAGSVDDFLRGLAMRIEIGPFDDATLPRIVQLIGKTNQFNLTTRRHTRGDLDRMIDKGGIGLWMRISDRFGDNGLVGVALAVPADRGAYAIDTFLMSCRVLGRKAEQTLLDVLARRTRERGAARLLGEFVSTKKNAPASTFLPDSGFVAVADSPGWFELALDDAPATRSTLFEVVEHP